MIKPFQNQECRFFPERFIRAISGYLVLALAVLFLQPDATAQESYPWPVNFQYTHGVMPAGANDADAWAAYEYWKTHFTINDPNCGRRVIFDYYPGTTRGHTDKSYTVSEGIAYGMLLAAYAGDRSLFDGCWAYYKRFRNGNGVMNWKIRNCNVEEENGASDAELDVAMALIVASYQWQNDDYLRDAKNMISIIRRHEFDGTVLKPGDAPGFGGTSLTCPSYFSPAYYRVFKDYDDPAYETFWEDAATRGYQIIEAAGGTTGLVPDWCTADGNASSLAAQYNYEDDGKNFIYDAIRTPWRSAVDYLWHGNADAKAYCEKITGWAYGHHGSASAIGSKYATRLTGNEPEGKILVPYNNNTFVGCFGAAAMAAEDVNNVQTWLNDCYNTNKNTTPRTGEYFNASFKVLTLFLMTGNFYLPPPDACDAPNLGADKSLCTGSPVVLDAVFTDRTYQWKKNGIIINGETGRTLSVTSPGVYEVITTTTDAEKCVRRDKVEVFAATIVPSFIDTKGPGNVTLTNTSTGGISNYSWVINGGTYVDHEFGTERDAFLDQIPAGSYEITMTASNSGFAGCSQIAPVTKTVIIGDGVGVAMDDFNHLYDKGIVVWDLANNAYFQPIPKIQCSREVYVETPDVMDCFNLPCSSLRITGEGDGTDGAKYTPFGIGFIEPAGPLDLTDVPFVSLKIRSSTDLDLSVKLSMGDWSSNSQVISLVAGVEEVYNIDFSDVLIGWDNAAKANATIEAYNAVDAIQFGPFEQDPDWAGTIDIDWIVIGAKSIPAPEFDYQKDEMGFNVYDEDGLVSTWQPPFDACDGLATVTAQSCTSDDIKWYSGTTLIGTGEQVELAPGEYIVHLENDGGVTADTFTVVGADLQAGFTYQIENQGKGLRLINTSQDFDSFLWDYGTTDIEDGAETWQEGFNYYDVEGTYTVCIDVTNDACSQTKQYCDDILIECYAPLGAIGPFSVTGGTVVDDTLTTCAGVSHTISIDSVSNGDSHGWYGMDGTVLSETRSVTTTFTASHWLKLEAYNVCGEKVTDSLFINVIPEAVPSFEATKIGGLEYSFKAEWVGEDATYEWYVDDVLLPESAIEVWHTFETDGEHQVKLVVTNDCGSDEITQPVGCSFPDVSAASITGAAALCAGDGCTPFSLTGVTGATTYTWEFTGGTICAGEGTANVEVDFATPGSLSVTVGNDCGDAEPVTHIVEVNPIPVTSDISGNESPACSGTGEVYSVTATEGSTYEWTVPDGATIVGDATGASITVDFGTTNGNVSVTETNAGCVGATKTFAVTLAGCSLDANFSADVTSACDGATVVTFTDISTGTSASTTYSWNFGAGANPPTAEGPGPHEVTYTGVGAKDVSLTIVDGAEDTEPKAAYITVITEPATPGTISGSADVCAGQTSTYSIDPVDGATSYTWTVPDGATRTGTGTSRDITFGTTGGDVTVAATNACGTSTASVLAVTVSNCDMMADFSADETSVCEGLSVIFTDASVGTSANTDYSWNFGAGANPETAVGPGPHTVTYSTAGTYDVTLDITEGLGSDSEPKVGYITVGAEPSTPVGFTGQDVVCGGETVTYSVDPVAGATSYSWSVPSDATISGSGATVDVTFGTAAGEVSVAAVNDCGTSDLAGVSVTVNDCNITADFSADVTDPCAGEIVTFTDASVGVTASTDYEWNFGTGAEPATAVGPGPHEVIYSTSGAKTVSLTITEGNYTDSEPKNSFITVNKTPNNPAGITGPGDACSGESVGYSIVAVPGATSYNWSVPSGATVSGPTNAVDITFGSSSGNISVTATNQCGTSGSSPSFSVFVTSCGLAANFTADKTSACAGSEIVFTNNSAGASASATYSWDFGAGANPPTATGIGPHTVTYSSAGAKDVSLTVTDGTTSDPESKTGFVNITPGAGTAGTVSGPTSVCNGETAEFSIAAVDGATSYAWSVPAGATKVESGTSVTVTFGSTGGNVTVTPSNSCGAGTASQKSVAVNTGGTPTVAIAASSNPIMEGESVTFTATPSNGGSTPAYEWFLNDVTVGTGATYSSSTLANGDKVYVVMTSSSTCAPGTDESDVITMSVDTPPTGASYAGADQEICEQRTKLNGNTPTCGTGTWSVVSGSCSFVNANDPKSDVTGLSFGINILRWTHEGVDCETSTDDVTINVIKPNVTIAVDANPICEGSSVTFTATPVYGGANPSYQWKINGHDVPSGLATFTVDTLKDGYSVRCKMTSELCNAAEANSSSIAMTVHDQPSVADAGEDQKITTTSCVMAAVPAAIGDGVWTLVSGPGTIATPTSASSSINDLVVGSSSTFAWTISSGVCPPSSDEVVITVGSRPAGATIVGDPSVDPGTETTYSVTENPGSSYVWTVPDGVTIISGQYTSSITVSFGDEVSGTITVTETNEFGPTPSSMNVATSVGVGTVGSYATQLKLFPNPFDNVATFTIEAPVKTEVKIRILDVKGLEVASYNGHFTNEPITIGEELNSGYYTIQVLYDDRAEFLKLIKMK